MLKGNFTRKGLRRRFRNLAKVWPSRESVNFKNFILNAIQWVMGK